MVESVGQTKTLKQRYCIPFLFVTGYTCQQKGNLDILQRGEVRHQVECLKHKSHFLFPYL